MATRSDHPTESLPPRPECDPDQSENERQPSPDGRRDSDERNRDALELHEIETQDDEAGTSTASISSGEYRTTTLRTGSRTSQRTVQSRAPRKGLPGYVQRFWTRNVVLTVPQKSNRDHFALERTFLAYIRTSVILAMQGVLVAQLFRLQRQTDPNSELGYYEVGVPLSVACHCAAILVAFMGAHRFFKQQNAVALGTVYAGGWELYCIGGLIGLIILATFVLSIIITVEIESHIHDT
ncbi:hypothetical protein P170DRAFT_446022 [Aspergillus steynii IBT 23096]|uniref:DUF202 domain-containing protein n=1 Tax=Aspergillus steynii IBT 23096 TaxID=1392250 RepID=A0A2I2GD26_9EURO|nr:uncharacterized protein P170DRAFT_446022 [Aspergillus steynii IBT 23096]PLB50775.1 hypothetical protein P170DRAFT_446022 [Aspergillus steynii IBT 23096]